MTKATDPKPAVGVEEFSDGSYVCRPLGTGPFPGVLYNHGGLGTAVGGDVAGTCQALAQAGYLARSEKRPETRPLAGHLDDVLDGLHRLRSHPDADATRIGVIGFSRGGLLTLQAAIDRPDDVHVAVLMAPAQGKTVLESTLQRVSSLSAPVHILVAENDINQANHVEIAKRIRDALDAKGKNVSLRLYPPYEDDGHRLFFSVQDPYWSDLLTILGQTLGTSTDDVDGGSRTSGRRDTIYGINPCSEDGPRAFTSSIVPLHRLTTIEPLGKMASSHVTPTDHLYVHWTPPVSGTMEYVMAPADGQIIEIGRFPKDEPVRYDPSITVPDYRMVIMHSCSLFTIFIHLGELAPAITDHTGPIPLGGLWFATRNGPIEIEAGDPLSKLTGTGLDWSVHDGNITLPGLIAPERYAGEPWKVHTVDPFQFYDEALKATLLEKVVRTAEPRAGKIDYDIEGTIAGNWFLDDANTQNDGVSTSTHWDRDLTIAYGYIDPSQIRISIGFETGIDDDRLCNVCFGAYGVRGNHPDPATIGVDEGVIKYELMSRQSPQTELVGNRSLGTFLVQHLGNRTLRIEVVTDKTPQEVSGFSDGARIYRR